MNASELKSRFSPGLTLALAALMIILSAMALWFLGRGEHLESAFVRDSQKAQLVSRMRADLYAAAEAEKSAVLAETDQASQDNAKRARAAAEQVAAGLKEFKTLPAGDAEEAESLRRLEDAFSEYRKADEEVLGLAVQNTNLKAFALSFGPATEALSEMERTLKPMLDAGGKGGKASALLASRALTEALRIQALHAPHITEKTEARMDALEKDMAEADRAVRSALAALGKEQAAAKALASYDQYWQTTTEIVALSRRNTNVRSLVLSLEHKTTVLAACDEALRVLEKSVRKRMAFKATR